MLLQFKVGNFRSFKELTTFSMVASPDKEFLDTNTIPCNEKLRLIKSAVIYGANASGKSNLFQAMDFMRDFMLYSSKESTSTEKIPVEKFRLSTETETLPSTFEIVFFLDNIRYRYGFQADAERIHAEWLFFVPSTREATLFTREKDNFKLGGHFKEGKGLEDKTRPNALFLSVADQFNGKKAKRILKWIKNLKIVTVLQSGTEESFTVSKLDEEDFKDFLLKFLNAADIGIKDLNKSSRNFTEDDLPEDLTNRERKRLYSMKKGVESKSKDLELIEINTIHEKIDANNIPISKEIFDLNFHESAGTKALFALSAPIYYTLKNNWVLIIDELTSKLHPLLTRAIIELFHNYNCDKEDHLKSSAQLLFASHDTSILTNRLFRRDQVWFTQKDRYGATELYSLEEYRIRKDASFNKDYMLGKYGAIPFLGDIAAVF